MIDLLYAAAGVAAIALMLGALWADARGLIRDDLRHHDGWGHARPPLSRDGWYALVLAAILALFLAAALIR